MSPPTGHRGLGEVPLFTSLCPRVPALRGQACLVLVSGQGSVTIMMMMTTVKAFVMVGVASGTGKLSVPKSFSPHPSAGQALA